MSMEQSVGEPRPAARWSGVFPPNVVVLTSAFNCTKRSANHYNVPGGAHVCVCAKHNDIYSLRKGEGPTAEALLIGQTDRK